MNGMKCIRSDISVIYRCRKWKRDLLRAKVSDSGYVPNEKANSQIGRQTEGKAPACGGSGSFFACALAGRGIGGPGVNHGALSCSGTHFIKSHSWGRGSMRPYIYHTNPSGLSPCTGNV